jgi:hypothetical protein
MIGGKFVNKVNPINKRTPAINIITSQFARDFEKNSKFIINGKVAVKIPIIMNTGGINGRITFAFFSGIASSAHPIIKMLKPIVTKEEID